MSILSRTIGWLTSNWQAVVAGAALVVSMCALLVAFGSFAIQRKHNRISVRPRLRRFIRRLTSGVQVGCKNVGLGPAVITRFEVIVLGRAWPSADINENEWRKICGRLNVGAPRSRFATFPEVLPAREEVLLLHFAWPDHASQAEIDRVHQAVRNGLQYKVSYQSMYADETYDL
jgi:hypothetical protein